MRALRPNDTLRSAGDYMRAVHAEAWPVVENEILVGMVDKPNPDWRAQNNGHDPDLTCVCSCMNPDVSCCYDDDDCIEALHFMLDRDFRYVSVADHEMRFVGIISLEEILTALIATVEDAGEEPP